MTNNTPPKAKCGTNSCGGDSQVSFQCSECSRCFSKVRGLRRHMYTHTLKQGSSIPLSTTETRQFQHKTSNIKFTYSSGLAKLNSTDTKEKRFQCSTCKARLAQSSNLKVQVRNHSAVMCVMLSSISLVTSQLTSVPTLVRNRLDVSCAILGFLTQVV